LGCPPERPLSKMTAPIIAGASTGTPRDYTTTNLDSLYNINKINKINESREKTYVTAYVPLEVRSWLASVGKSNDLSISNVVKRILISSYLAHDNPELIACPSITVNVIYEEHRNESISLALEASLIEIEKKIAGIQEQIIHKRDPNFIIELISKERDLIIKTSKRKIPELVNKDLREKLHWLEEKEKELRQTSDGG